jgi:hypothetical protein
MLYNVIILTIIVTVISITYYNECKKKEEKFTYFTSIKSFGKATFKGLAFGGFFMGLVAIYNLVIPLNKNHGIEFNSEREKLGIPKIGDNWENPKYSSDQFTTIWWKPESTVGHFKKVIEYGIINVKSETDYYKCNNRKATFAWSKYDFENNTTEYFIEKPNYKTKAVKVSGNMKTENSTIIEKIDKSEFEKYKAE